MSTMHPIVSQLISPRVSLAVFAWPIAVSVSLAASTFAADYEVNAEHVTGRKLVLAGDSTLDEHGGGSEGDRTHPAPKGARLYAGLFLDDVLSRGIPVAALFLAHAASGEDDHPAP